MSNWPTTVTSPVRRPCVVVSQPMYFPWPGLLEQVRLGDTFVHYGDVQFARSAFTRRVQIKTAQGIRWLTVPLQDVHQNQLIDDVRIDESTDWRRKHRDTLRHAHAQAPFRDEMLELVDAVFAGEYRTLGALATGSTMALVEYFGLNIGRTFHHSSTLGVAGASTQRLVDLCIVLGAETYLTGHGARRYLDHTRFEERGIDVRYIDYGLAPWPQAHGRHTPYVTALDLVANCGRAGAELFSGRAVPWRDFLDVKEKT